MRIQQKKSARIGLTLLEFCVILHCYGDGIESGHALALQKVIAATFGFLIKMTQNVRYNFLHPLWSAHCSFNVDGSDILVLDIIFLFTVST